MDEETQQKFVQYQVLQQNMQSIQHQIQQAAQRIMELQIAKNSMEELGGTKPSNALIPLGADNFISGSIDDSNSVFVTIGSGVVLKKSREEAFDILNSKISLLDSLISQMRDQERSIVVETQKLQLELEKLAENQG